MQCLYAARGRPWISPEQLFLALVGGYSAGHPERSQAGDGTAVQDGAALETSGTGAQPSYTVNARMENRNRILPGLGVEIFRSSAFETEGCQALLNRAKQRLRFVPGPWGDKGYFSERMIEHLLDRGIEPHIAHDVRGASALMRAFACGCGVPATSARKRRSRNSSARAKNWHGMRRFRRRGLLRVREEAWLIGRVLHLKTSGPGVAMTANARRTDHVETGTDRHSTVARAPGWRPSAGAPGTSTHQASAAFCHQPVSQPANAANPAAVA